MTITRFTSGFARCRSPASDACWVMRYAPRCTADAHTSTCSLYLFSRGSAITGGGWRNHRSTACSILIDATTRTPPAPHAVHRRRIKWFATLLKVRSLALRSAPATAAPQEGYCAPHRPLSAQRCVMRHLPRPARAGIAPLLRCQPIRLKRQAGRRAGGLDISISMPTYIYRRC